MTRLQHVWKQNFNAGTVRVHAVVWTQTQLQDKCSTGIEFVMSFNFVLYKFALQNHDFRITVTIGCLHAVWRQVAVKMLFQLLC